MDSVNTVAKNNNIIDPNNIVNLSQLFFLKAKMIYKTTPFFKRWYILILLCPPSLQPCPPSAQYISYP